MSAVAATALAFNLICTGSASYSNSHAPDDLKQGVAPISSVFSIDLKRGLWCEDMVSDTGYHTGCTNVWPIRRVSKFEIILLQLADATDTYQKWLNRTTGTYYESTIKPGFKRDGSAQCVKRAFTGFPANKF